MIRLFTWLLDRLVRFGLELAAALVKGILGAPATAARRAVMAVTIERATADEVIDLRWKVLRAGRPRETANMDGDREPTTRHWKAVHDGRIVGVATVIRSSLPAGTRATKEYGWQLRGMAVEPTFQNGGVGGKLLAAAVAEVGEPMWCNARVTAVPFYARAGWREVTDTFDVKDVGPHRRMVLDR